MRRSRVLIATLAPLATGGLAWWACVAGGMDLDTTGIVVGLVVLLPATPLAIWAGAGEPRRAAARETVKPADGIAAIGEVPCRPRAFQPRPDLRDRMEDILASGRPCCLIGGEGVGKTQLAAAYARACLDDGVPVAWLAAESLTVALAQMAGELGLLREGDGPEEVRRKVRSWLAGRREPYVLVMDSAADPDEVAALLPATGGTRVLITTNTHAFERVAEPVVVDRFTAGEALAYLRERVGPGDVAAARALVRELDRLPLALAVAAACMVGPPRLPYAAYIARLRAVPVDRLLERPSGEPYPRGVAQAILLSLRAVGRDSRELLAQLSVMAPAGVGTEFLRGERLTELAGQSLVSFSRDGSAVVHRLVQRVVRESEGSLAATVERAARRLLGIRGVADEDTWRRLPYINAVDGHAAALWQHAGGDGGTAAELVLEVRQAVAQHLLYLNDGLRAAPILREVAEGWARLHGQDDPRVLEARDRLATAHEFAGRFDEAVERFGQVVADRERVLGPDDPATLITRLRLAAAHEAAGDWDEARREYGRVAERMEAVLGAQQPMTAAAWEGLARVSAG
ncbi:tetratricopeptide repeat protein [Nonomuraea sp. NPDC050663]|uniref:tetratricopeptide repeat protein n=1 Tax=Nonomuraea sp. NPDC050663 TaxID=3364370 RepID=UPI0037A109FD